MFIPAVAASGCLFRGVQGSCAKCEGTFAAFSLMLFLVWRVLIVIEGHASSDWSPGPMLMWVRLGLFHGMSLYVFVTLCVCVMHNVCVVLGSSLVFLAFLLCGNRKKRLSYVFYHNKSFVDRPRPSSREGGGVEQNHSRQTHDEEQTLGPSLKY